MNDLPVRNEVASHRPDDVSYTLTCIDSFINQDASQPWVVTRARRAVADELARLRHPPKGIDETQLVQTRGIWRWIKNNIAFVHDPVDGGGQTELVADCEVILRHAAGDCDEHVILAGAMLRAIGFRKKQLQIWVGGPYDKRQRTHVPIHVFLVVYSLGGQGIVFDTTIDKPFGTRAGDSTWQYWLWQPGD